MKCKISKIGAITGAKWWADKLRNGAKMDSGDRWINAVASFLRKPQTLSGESIDIFERILVGIILHRQPMHIGVDYHPDEILSDALKMAKIDSAELPWKTSMWIDGDTVKVRYGYGANIEIVPTQNATGRITLWHWLKWRLG